ncbi:MAG: hemerythrin domain-containing protein [Polyangia bacterium]
MSTSRRAFLVGGGAALLVGANARAAGDDDDEVGPTEDLMREHGVLRRLLLVYREASRRLGAGETMPTAEVAHAATIVREFIEDYHERDEEEYLFPALEKAHKHADLVATLRAQHQAGRKLTADLLRFAAPAANVRVDRRAFADALDKFVRMYEPHAAFEDTILFPAFRALVGEKQLHKLQDVFEAKEKALPHGGFEKVVADVARIERAFGIGDLAKFTPA